MAFVFGVFDRLHEGHKFFFRQAQSYAASGQVIVVVALDSVVESRKGQNPNRQTQTVRCSKIDELGAGMYKSVLGDALSKEGTYSALCNSPVDNVICLGYDQLALLKDLVGKMESGKLIKRPIFVMQSFEPEKFHTSLLYKTST